MHVYDYLWARCLLYISMSKIRFSFEIKGLSTHVARSGDPNVQNVLINLQDQPMEVSKDIF